MGWVRRGEMSVGRRSSKGIMKKMVNLFRDRYDNSNCTLLTPGMPTVKIPQMDSRY